MLDYDAQSSRINILNHFINQADWHMMVLSALKSSLWFCIRNPKLSLATQQVVGQPELHESLSTNQSTSCFKKEGINLLTMFGTVIEKYVLLIQWKIKRSPFLCYHNMCCVKTINWRYNFPQPGPPQRTVICPVWISECQCKEPTNRAEVIAMHAWGPEFRTPATT